MELDPDDDTLVPKCVGLNKVYCVSSLSSHILFKLCHTDQFTVKLFLQFLPFVCE